MSSNQKFSLPAGASRRWKHPLVFASALVGFLGSSAVYYAQIRARQKARNLFLEQTFFEEAMNLTRGYKPITEKLVEPIEPLQIDTTSKFNYLSASIGQVEIPVRGVERAGVVYCYATRETANDEWHVDKLEFKGTNQNERFLFYDRSLRRLSSTEKKT